MKTDRWALITGASSGIGLELAREFAADQWNVALLARDEARLNAVAAELEQAHKIRTRVLALDLSLDSAAQTAFAQLRDIPVSALVNNAGLGFHGEFSRSDLREQESIMQVNMLALVRLTRLFLDPMLERKAGWILNVASTAAFQPGPTVSVYYASKAFVHSFSYALSVELENSGVTVTVLCPGTTRTAFFERGHFASARGPVVMDAQTVANAGYRGLMRGRREVIPGLGNWILARLARIGPTAIAARVVRRIHG